MSDDEKKSERVGGVLLLEDGSIEIGHIERPVAEEEGGRGPRVGYSRSYADGWERTFGKN